MHEFLPSYEELVQRLADLKVQLQHFHTLSEIDEALSEIRVKQAYLERVEALREQNPMLGTRGVRLGIIIPELTKMQAVSYTHLDVYKRQLESRATAHQRPRHRHE